VIVRSVLGLGRALSLKVVAEGVDSQAELAFLEDEACDEVQGFPIGIPRNIDSLRELTHPGPTRRQELDSFHLWKTLMASGSGWYSIGIARCCHGLPISS
jgi:predicted signal transduction protein with EAL and GGDEF domain